MLFLFQVITEFLRLVNVTEQNHITKGTVMFASQVTMESLRVTLASVLDLIRDLSEGADYVLTEKLNHDPLERFFGVTRTFGGDEDHLTIVSFSHIHKLLSLYTPIKTCIVGNVVPEPTLVLAAVQETMKAGKKERKATHERLQDDIKLKLLELYNSSKAASAKNCTAPDHSYSTPTAQDCVVY
nr:uncharacterized protein LOC119167700 [Rhipicephalus microplus]